jgi:uncharacterized protein (AIM24 family)
MNSCWIELKEKERLFVKPGAMLAQKNLGMETHRANRCMRRFCYQEPIFLNIFYGKQGGGSLLLEHKALGQIRKQILRPGEAFILRTSAFLAATCDVDVLPEWSGIKNVFLGMGTPFHTRVSLSSECTSESGFVVFSTEKGILHRIQVTPHSPLIVDNKNIVAYSSTLSRSISVFGLAKSWKSIFFSQEGMKGIVSEFTGSGIVFIASNT